MRNKRRLLHPATGYFLLAVAVVLFSWVADIYELTHALPATGEEIRIRSVLSAEGMRWLLRHVVTNFTGFAPVGMAVMVLFGLGIAEHSGLLQAFVRRFLRGRYAQKIILLSVIVLGILSNVVGDAGYVLLVPLSAFLFRAIGSHPVAGIVIAYVSVACGYSANVFIGTMDPLLARITCDAIVASGLHSGPVGALSNSLFMGISAIWLALLMYLAGRRFMHSLGPYESVADDPIVLNSLSRKERRAFSLALWVGFFHLVLIVLATFSPWGILRGITGGMTRSPFIVGALFLMSLGMGLMGAVYGFASGTYRTDSDVVRGLSHHFPLMGSFFVLAFFASQLLACFSYSQLDRWLAVQGAGWLSGISVGPVLQLLFFIGFTAFVNLFMVSSTAKWSLLSFLFVPLFATMGVSPEWVQCAYRIGDSTSNATTPFMFYVPFVLACLLRYVPDCGFSDLFRYTWRFTWVIGVGWTVLFLVWYALGWPLGW